MARRTLEPEVRGRVPSEALPVTAVVSVVGPDGAGKTTLIDGLVASYFAGAPLLRLRRPGVLYRRSVPDVPVTEPHGAPPYPYALSLAKTAYIFIDVLLGWTLRIRPFVRRGGWVVIERGWWDIAVDPRRNRLRAHGGLLWRLGALLPRPDLLLVLEAPAEVIHARKTELSIEELDRQARAWRDRLPRRQRTAYLDATLPASEVLAHAEEEIRRLGRDVTAAGRTPGWTGVPRGAGARWVLPRAPRAVARSGLLVYQPINSRARIGWEAARVMARAGAFRLLPRSAAPPDAVRAALADHLEASDTLAVARTNHRGRYIALVISGRGVPRAVAKVATDADGGGALLAEARAVAELGAEMTPPLRAPHIVAQADGVLLYEMTTWRPRLRPWLLPLDAAAAIGRFYRAGGGPAGVGLAHGDFAPWNLLRAEEGWVLIDWESARRGAPPFYDVWHYLIQGHALLGRPTQRALFDGLGGRGWVGSALRAYAEGAGLSEADARAWLPLYLEASKATLDPARRDGAAGLRARARLLAQLRGP